MRYLLFIFPVLLLTFSCVKPPSTDPVPALEFKSMNLFQASTTTTAGVTIYRDTAVLVVGYSDGDGDLFRNANSDGPNFLSQAYSFNADSNKFVTEGTINSLIITQPANGYYKGKSIHGDIYVPMTQFRSGNKVKILKFTAFMVDMQSHKSNMVTSPVYTINF